jgi:hypothetical protein
LSQAIPINRYSFLDGFRKGLNPSHALRYVFRELAVSYMGRFDLANVDPSESNFDAWARASKQLRPTAPSLRHP